MPVPQLTNYWLWNEQARCLFHN